MGISAGVCAANGVGDRANKFIGLLSERYTGLSPGSRARRGSRGTGKGDGTTRNGGKRGEEGRLSGGRARKIVKTLYNSAEGRYSGHPDDGELRRGNDCEGERERERSGGVSASERFNEGR